MAQLKDKVQNALNEGRMLILGSQVLLGFQFRSVFEPGFEKLPEHSQYLKLVGLALLLIAIALLMWPASYHRIVAEGEDTEDVHSFTTGVMDWALLPFALAASVFMLIVFYGLWFGYTAYRRGKDNQGGRLGEPLSAE